MGLCKFEGEHFLHMMYREKNGTYLTHLYFIGSKEKAQHFEYSVQVVDAAKKNKTTFESSDIPLMDTCSSDIRRNQMGLLLIENMVKRCMVDKTLTFSYKLKKISGKDATLSPSAGPSPKIRRPTVALANNGENVNSNQRQSI